MLFRKILYTSLENNTNGQRAEFQGINAGGTYTLYGCMK